MAMALDAHTLVHPGLAENIASDGARDVLSLLKDSPLKQQLGARCFFLHSDFSRVLLGCGKGVTNQQWSTAGMVNNILDPHQVQYSLLTQGGLTWCTNLGFK